MSVRATTAALPRSNPPILAVGALLTGMLLAIGAGMLLELPIFTLILVGIITVALTAAVIATHIRSSRRQESLDLCLMRLYGTLGWPAPAREQLTATRWRGGWFGKPTRLLVRYNPIADESFPEILGETKRIVERAFDSRYKLGKHKPRKGWFQLALNTEEADTSKDAQIERVHTVIAKTFGGDAKASTKFVDDKLREITVRYEVTPRLSSSALRGRIESQISSVLDGRWRAFWDLQNDTVRLEVRPDMSGVIFNPNRAPAAVDPLASYDDLKVPFAVDEDGNTIYWRPKRDPHGLITGKTGAGKTVAMLGIIQFLAAQGWEIWGIDGKRIELLGLRSWPNVRIIAGRIDHQARVAHEVFRTMQQRFEDYESGRMRLEDFTPVLFPIDEFKTFKNAVTRWYRTVKPKGPGTQPPVLEEISDFMSLARKVRMHALLGLQRPDAEFLTGDMRDNFGFRASFGRLSPDGAQMMWNSYSTGVTVPVNAKGRGIAYDDHGTPVEIQAYWTPDPYQTEPEHPENWVFPDDLKLVQQITPKHTIHQLMAIVDPEDQADLDGTGTDGVPDYNDYMAARIVTADRIDELQHQARGLITGLEDDDRAAELDRIQREEAEPELDDAEELFAGYTQPDELVVEEVLTDDGTLAREGMLALVDPDTNTWGLVETAEYDEFDEGYIAFTYRDFETGEPGTLSLPSDGAITVRSPEGR